MDELLGKALSTEDRQSLKQRLERIQRDSYEEVMPSQMQEMLADTESLLQNLSVKEENDLPSRSVLRRETTKAMVALKREVYHKAVNVSERPRKNSFRRDWTSKLDGSWPTRWWRRPSACSRPSRTAS